MKEEKPKEMLGGCCVCSDEVGWSDNPLIYCDGPSCEVAVHQGCYGIQEVPLGEWFCEKCRESTSYDVHPAVNGLTRKSKVPRCELCPLGYGALKRTENGGWAHVVCALYIPEARFGDVHTMDPVILSEIPIERFSKMCYLCHEENPKLGRMGACMECHRSSCKRFFHVTCAQQRGMLCEETGISKTVKYCGFCHYHLKKGTADPSIKSVPPCKIPLPRPASDSVVETPPSSNNSGHMLEDPIPRPQAINSVLGLTQSVTDDAHLANNFSPPLTTSSRSSVALESTPPLASQTIPKVDTNQMNGSIANSSNSLNALMNMGQNHNRLPEPITMIQVHDRNGHAEDNSYHGTTPSISRPPIAVKRPREIKVESSEKVKKPRPSNRKNNMKSEAISDFQALLDAVGPIVSDTVSDIQRERVAVRLEAERRATQTVQPSTSHETHEAKTAIPSVASSSSHTIGSSPSTSRESNLPASMEALLERQWDQGAQLLMGHAQFDVSQLLTCLNQLKQENSRLEEQFITLTKRREHLLALNSRLSVPLSAPDRHPPAHNFGLGSPHHSPHVPSISDDMSQVRGLATNRVMASGQRPPSQANIPPPVSFATPQSRPPVSAAPLSSVPPLSTPPTSQPTSHSSLPPTSQDLSNISPERLAASMGVLAPLAANHNFNIQNARGGMMPPMDAIVQQLLLQQIGAAARNGVFPPGTGTNNLFSGLGGLIPPINGPSGQNGTISK